MKLTTDLIEVLNKFDHREFTVGDLQSRLHLAGFELARRCRLLVYAGYLSSQKVKSCTVYTKVLDYVDDSEAPEAAESPEPETPKMVYANESELGDAIRAFSKEEGQRKGLPKPSQENAIGWDEHCRRIALKAADMGGEFVPSDYAAIAGMDTNYASALTLKARHRGLIEASGKRGKSITYRTTSKGLQQLEAAQ